MPLNSTSFVIDSAQPRMTSLLIHRLVDKLIQNKTKIDKTLCGSFQFTMANNLMNHQVEELQQQQEELDPPAEATNSDLKANISSNSLLNEIIIQSLGPKPAKRLSFRTLARVVMALNRALKAVTPDPEGADLDYWRNLAKSRGEMSSRYCQVIEMQRKRIETLERDLRTLIGLARETRVMLSEIAMEKLVDEDHGDGGHPY